MLAMGVLMWSSYKWGAVLATGALTIMGPFLKQSQQERPYHVEDARRGPYCGQERHGYLQGLTYTPTS